jgi:putative phosphoesterase
MGRQSKFRATMIIGLLSDTHGLLRPRVHEVFAGVELILHAGDVGGHEILDELAGIAPVRAVFGNTDPPGAPGLEWEIVLTLPECSIHVSHGHQLGRPTPEGLLARYPQDVLVYGHTHELLIHREGKRLVINPGAAGPRRFNLRPSVARLTIADGATDVEPFELD